MASALSAMTATSSCIPSPLANVANFFGMCSTEVPEEDNGDTTVDELFVHRTPANSQFAQVKTDIDNGLNSLHRHTSDRR